MPQGPLGSRSFCARVLDDFHKTRGPFTCLNHGAAPGADAHAANWAIKNRVPIKSWKADWKRHRNAAGPRRNQQMIDDGKPELVIAFPGGRGTADMVQRARASGIEVFEVVQDQFRSLGVPVRP